MHELEVINRFIAARKEILCDDTNRYEKVMSELQRLIQDNNLTVGETKDFFTLAYILNGLKNGINKPIAWINSEIQNQ